MPRIIFKCQYLKRTHKQRLNQHQKHLSNIVEYIATREGVGKLPENARQLPTTLQQQRTIAAIVSKFPEAADLWEYADYVQSPTRENAAEFIVMAVEQHLDVLGKRENIVGYVAGRPGVERQGAHGLFTDAGVPVVLSEVAREVAEHPGNVWTNIISLRREDAARLGYDNAQAWRALLRSQRNKLAQEMKIRPDHLKWYAAFHNEGHHPHVHLIVYSTDPREAYVTKEAIERIRSSLAREIFKQDLLHMYEEQTRRRDQLNSRTADVMRERITQLQSGNCDNPVLAELLVQLAERLKRTSGKKQYGYLKASVKALVDRIVDELEKDERVAECYASWYELRHDVLCTYTDQLPPRLPLSAQKEFKSIRNRVIAEALAMEHSAMPVEQQAEHLASEPAVKAANETLGGMGPAQPVIQETDNPVIRSHEEERLERKQRGREERARLLVAEAASTKQVAPAQFVERPVSPHAKLPFHSPDHRSFDFNGASSAGIAATRLLQHLGDLFENEYKRIGAASDIAVDSKLRRKLRRKKLSQGHAHDDHVPRQT